MFRARFNSVKAKLKMLRDKNIIDDETYRCFLHRGEGAKTLDQLDTIDHDLTEKGATEVLERLVEERFVSLSKG